MAGLARAGDAERALIARRAAAVAGVLLVVAAFAPRVETESSGEPVDEVLPEAELVRVVRDGRTLVWDKRSGWLGAKAAEMFPRAATRVIPADYVDDGEGRIFRARNRARAPWWR